MEHRGDGGYQIKTAEVYVLPQMRSLVLLFAILSIGLFQDVLGLAVIEREDRSEGDALTIEDFETQERRDAIDDFWQKVMEMRQEYNKKLAACGEANNFTPFGNCNKCKADCKGAGTCSLTDCREICREDKKILESKKCDLAVDNSVFKNLWRNIGGRRKNKPAPEDAVKNMDNDYKAVPKPWTRHKTR